MEEVSTVRWLVTGARGMLGRDLLVALQAAGQDVRGLGSAELDVRDGAAVAREVREVDVVVNAAAWTAVDDAETHEAEAHAVNATGAGHLARAAARAGARLVQVSTDYVFPGDARTPYRELDPVDPRSAYGRTKAAGERAVLGADAEHLVVRTAWLYGAHGACFPRTIARLARERDHLDVVDDQHGQPTWTRDVARVVVDLVLGGVPGGVYHATSSGSTTWFGFAQEVVHAAGLDPAVVRPCTTADFPRPAPRPAWSVLGHEALTRVGVEPIGPWRERWRRAAREVLAGVSER